MSVNITMPALSPTMEEGNLSKWLVKEGDTVSAGDVIAEIETDKATMEVEAVDEGIVARILVPEGSEGVRVNAVIAVLAQEGEEAGSVDVNELEAAVAAPAPALVPAPAGANVIAETVPEAVSGVAAAETVGTQIPASGSSASVSAPPSLLSSTHSEHSGSGRKFASPLARRIAEQKGIDLSRVSGSGPHGRIVKADVEQAVEAGGSAASDGDVAAAPALTGMVNNRAGDRTDDQVLALYEPGSYEVKPHDGMRRVIAERLGESNRTVPSYTVSMDCEIDTLLAARTAINADAPVAEGSPAYRISVNDFIVKALAMALQKVPMANSSWTSDARILHNHSDVGVAVAVDDGLFTPVVRRAELKSLSEISAEVRDLAARARSKRLKPEDYQGGSTAVSNLGMFGVKEFTSIINPPHASIVSIGVGEQRPVVKDGELTVATVMIATFAFDHRCIDGALGGKLALVFKQMIENPVAMLV